MFVMIFGKENKIKQQNLFVLNTFIRLSFELSVLQYHFQELKMNI